MIIAKYGISELHKTTKNGEPYYMADCGSCSTSGYANSDAEAIQLFANFMRVPLNRINIVKEDSIYV